MSGAPLDLLRDRLQGPAGALALLALSAGLLLALMASRGAVFGAQLNGYADLGTVPMAAPMSARVAELRVQPGEVVEEGAVLVRMDTAALVAQRQVILAERAAWQEQGRFARGEPAARAQDAAEARAALQREAGAARAELSAMGGQRSRLAQLVAEGLEAPAAVAELDVRINVLNAELRGLDAQLAALDQGAAAPAPAAADPTLAVWDAQLALVDAQIADAELRAPAAGRVGAVQAAVGQWAREGWPLLEVVPERSARVIVCLGEGEAELQDGDRVRVRPREGGAPLLGTVSGVGAAVLALAPATKTNASRCARPTPWPSYGRPAYVQLDPGAALTPGERVTVEAASPPTGPVGEAQAKGAQ